LLDGVALLLGERAGVGEVEGELIRLDLRAALLDVLAEYGAECPVQKVRRRVVLAREVAIFGHRELRSLTGAEGTAVQHAQVHYGVANLVGFVHVELPGRGLDRALVSDLAAGFSIEARSVEN